MTTALGAMLLATLPVVVRKLTGIESLAGVNILCSGTTANHTAHKLSTQEPLTSEDTTLHDGRCGPRVFKRRQVSRPRRHGFRLPLKRLPRCP
ncbi:hypothetical protein OC861_006510 [Tilletia horrida]|nr:hypothetical protein OC861_006510 [Tilletia horrida]